MKKIILSLVVMFTTVITANAQLATQNQKFFDNVYVGVEGGVATPLSFDNVFPLNSIAGLKVGKEITPVVGFELEGQVFFNDNNFQRWTNTFVKGTNLTLNGTINLSNLFAGYKGTPRFFEVKTNTGLGWLRYWKAGNGFSVKTAVDFNFNLGKKKAHTLFVSPGVYWDLKNDTKIQFNKNKAQFAVFAGYVYHFKTSNGTHHFKVYDVGAMMEDINKLYEENGDLKKAIANQPKPTVVTKQEVKVVKDVQYVNTTYIVDFAQNSYELSDTAKVILNKVEGIVDVYGYASPEGSATYNKELSQKRADVVAAYLNNRGVEIRQAIGKGVVGITSNRTAIVHIVPNVPNKK